MLQLHHWEPEQIITIRPLTGRAGGATDAGGDVITRREAEGFAQLSDSSVRRSDVSTGESAMIYVCQREDKKNLPSVNLDSGM